MTNEEKFDKVMSIVKEDNSTVLPDSASISKGILRELTQESLQDYGEVIEKNDFLSREFKHIVSLYGFDDFYSLYAYADFCDTMSNLAIKGGNKDLSKLKKVKRTVMRNGKPTEMTFYESTTEEENKDKKEESNTKRQGVSTVSAKDLLAELLKSKGEPEKVTQLIKIILKFPDTPTNPKVSDYFYQLKDDSGEVVAVAGYSIGAQYVSLDFYTSNGSISGVASRAFFELLRIAIEKDLGAELNDEDNELAQVLFSKFNFQLDEGKQRVSARNLKKHFKG
ncbi:hypothetical protein LP083-2_089 [Listeria phage LP-083-2]|uniref:Uncharacterized protein n=3 Tax=Pecentumvirus TaxID=1857844 RepID=A0A059T8A0_9CAUD|nr:virion structural protein [Listeria phage LP-083-2]YP_009784522.1 hypothetical protein QLX40_gp010 [Listeria phage LP-124]AHL19296.1 hypothetical protein LP083-2_089 [Listeria phage LP-083-2]AHL19407.1 hypothetical protein LP124_010 [Listeria phage LP-124]QDK04921.2 hypothetical protein FK486_0074 [Listeria phage LP-066]